MSERPPVIVFGYTRADVLRRTLDGLRANKIPKLIAFSDGPKTPAATARVEEVRQIFRAIDWTEVELVERAHNLGLGRSIRAGVTEVLERHEAAIVFEDDLVCVPGTYDYLAAALEHYRDDPRVMSVTAWTHPRIAPPTAAKLPYFDGRAESWTWGTWRRAWRGMDRDAAALIADCRARGIDPARFGADLLEQARVEHDRNLWAVRWLYLHISQRGLCMRPPHSMVDHVGLDHLATNAGGEQAWAQPNLPPAPAIPDRWPDPVEDPACARLWQAAAQTQRNELRWLVKRAVQRAIETLRRARAMW